MHILGQDVCYSAFVSTCYVFYLYSKKDSEDDSVFTGLFPGLEQLFFVKTNFS